MQVSCDYNKNRLICKRSVANENFWDSQWLSRISARSINRKDPFVVSESLRRLHKGAKVLDAGCGMANTVWGLQHAGFDAYGIDFAPATIAAVNQLSPQLKVTHGDVRALPFEDSSFDGIWSLGVIEHFSDGYDQILDEMWRVLKEGGYAFVTVPSISPLRRIKIKLKKYPAFDHDYTDFYQFILSKQSIIENFQAKGWTFKKCYPMGGFKGLKDESGPFKQILQRFYDVDSALVRIIRSALNFILAPISFHTCYYLFQKVGCRDLGNLMNKV